MPVSVLVLTSNEAVNLPRCLESVRWSDDIIVFDSFSSDGTVQIAEKYGARVFQRRFDNEQTQRTASLRLPFKYPWVFNPDADEVTPVELSREILTAVADPGGHNAFRVRFKNMFLGRWIRHSSLYPTWIVRLFRPESISFRRNVNLQYITAGSEGFLQNHLLHYSFNKGFEAWFEKHNRYSSGEARELIDSLGREMNFRELFTLDPVARRRALKELSFHVPARATLRFVYMYFLRLGFLDGVPGYHYCRLLSLYEQMISLKAMEFCRRAQSLPL